MLKGKELPKQVELPCWVSHGLNCWDRKTGVLVKELSYNTNRLNVMSLSKSAYLIPRIKLYEANVETERNT